MSSLLIHLLLISLAVTSLQAEPWEEEDHAFNEERERLLVSSPSHELEPSPTIDLSTDEVAYLKKIAFSKQLEFVLVKDPVNYPDINGFGAVQEIFQMGKNLITAQQYCAFLNAVAAEDPYGLFDLRMQTDEAVKCIRRFRNQSPYYYEVIGKKEKMPITYVSAACGFRFCNWLHNGCPEGPEGLGTTENGAYLFHHEKDQEWVEKMPDALYFIPTEDQWYKAAYYRHDAQTTIISDSLDLIPSIDNNSSPSWRYWDYPTQSMSEPWNTITTSCGYPLSTVANYHRSHNWYYPKYTTEQASYWSLFQISPTYRLTPAGSFTASPGPYGTFDMGGNVAEWTSTTSDKSYAEENLNTAEYVIRGGSWNSEVIDLHRNTRHFLGASQRNNTTGLRIAAPAAPPKASSLEIKQESSSTSLTPNPNDDLTATVITQSLNSQWGAVDMFVFCSMLMLQESYAMAFIYNTEGGLLKNYLSSKTYGGMFYGFCYAIMSTLYGFNNTALEWMERWGLQTTYHAALLKIIDSSLAEEEAKQWIEYFASSSLVQVYKAIGIEINDTVIMPIKNFTNSCFQWLTGSHDATMPDIPLPLFEFIMTLFKSLKNTSSSYQ